MSAACPVCTWPSDSTNAHVCVYMLAWERGNVILGTRLARCCVMVWEQDKRSFRSFRFISVFHVLRLPLSLSLSLVIKLYILMAYNEASSAAS